MPRGVNERWWAEAEASCTKQREGKNWSKDRYYKCVQGTYNRIEENAEGKGAGGSVKEFIHREYAQGRS